MENNKKTSPANDSRGIRRDSARICSLAMAETIVWAAMFYSFPALLSFWEADFGWSKVELTIALTLALVLSAVCAPVAGRIIDKGHGRLLLTGSAILGAILTALVPFTDSQVTFVAVWALIGLSMAGCFYEPCFAFVVNRYGALAKTPITWITLAAGFAGTLSFPAANLLATSYDWRVSLWFFAALTLFVAVPLFWFGGDIRQLTEPQSQAQKHPVIGIGTAMKQRAFWFSAIAFAAITLNHGVLITLFLPLLDNRGLPREMSLLLVSLIGPMQVAGRLCIMLASRWITTYMSAVVSYAFLILSSVSLYFGEIAYGLIFIVPFLQGSAVGILTIVRPVITEALFGRTSFGVIAGATGIMVTGGYALAPSVGGFLWEFGGEASVLAALFGLASVGGLSFAIAITNTSTRRTD